LCCYLDADATVSSIWHFVVMYIIWWLFVWC